MTIPPMINPGQFVVTSKFVKARTYAMLPVVGISNGATRSMPADLTGTVVRPRLAGQGAIEHPVDGSQTAKPLEPEREPLGDPTTAKAFRTV